MGHTFKVVHTLILVHVGDQVLNGPVLLKAPESGLVVGLFLGIWADAPALGRAYLLWIWVLSSIAYKIIL